MALSYPLEFSCFFPTTLISGKVYKHYAKAARGGYTPAKRTKKALDVSIESLFNDPADIEGFVLLNGKPYHFNDRKELSALGAKSIRSISLEI